MTDTRTSIARIIDEHSVDTVKMHGEQNASRHAVCDAAKAFAKADAILALAANNQEAWVAALLNSPNPEQPAAAPVTGRNEIIEECASVIKAYANRIQLSNADAYIRVIRRLKSLTAPESRHSSGEPIREDNYMSNDFDKGDDA